MKEIWGIYHTHSRYSKLNHGKSTVEEMIDGAEAIGLKEYAITDHGYRHIFGIRKNNIPKLKERIVKYSENKNVVCKMGLEFNLLGANGECDFVEKYADLYDIRLLGAHKAGIVNFKNLFKFILPNVFKNKSIKVKDMNTESYIQAIKKYKIDIITHPNEYIKIDPYKLAVGCVENNCYLEINNKHMSLSAEDISVMLKTDVQFIISSDAHIANRVGSVERAVQFVKDNNIPIERIANWEKIPNFENKYTKEEENKE
jgi:putative hydrolase